MQQVCKAIEREESVNTENQQPVKRAAFSAVIPAAYTLMRLTKRKSAINRNWPRRRPIVSQFETQSVE